MVDTLQVIKCQFIVDWEEVAAGLKQQDEWYFTFDIGGGEPVMLAITDKASFLSSAVCHDVHFTNLSVCLQNNLIIFWLQLPENTLGWASPLQDPYV